MITKDNPRFQSVGEPYSWSQGNFTKINAIETGTPCLRYLVRQPDGHRDVGDFEKGEYSFGAFGFRREIGGEIDQRKRDKLSFVGKPLIAYCPDFGDPFGLDFFGVTCPGLYNFEVLDKFQQKFTLVGVAHLYLHTRDMNGAMVVSFNSDGSLRYVEAKIGERRNHDSVLLYDDRVEFKLGSNLTGIKREGKEIFGVPKWAFSEDVSAKVIAQFNSDLVEAEFTVVKNLPEGNLRLGHPREPGQFSNRQIGTEVQVNCGSKPWSRAFDFEVESSMRGVSRIQLSIDTTSIITP